MRGKAARAGLVVVLLGSACNSEDLPSPLGAASVPEDGDSDAGPPGVVTLNDAAAAIDPNASYSVTLAMTPFTVSAGGEVYKCQDFANPFGNQAVDVDRYDLQMSEGSHHMLLLYADGADDGPLIDCPQGGLQIGAYTFGAQSPTVTAPYPAGIGAAIPAGMGFTVDAHYLNTTASEITGQVRVTLYVAQPGSVTQQAGVLSYILTTLSVPPTGMPYTVSGSCALAQDVNLLSANSHMHRQATEFVATSGGMTLFQTDVWSEPTPRTFSPPLALSAGSTIAWSCTYVNDTGAELTFGESALSNAMCNFGASFYPVQDPSNPVVQCLQ
jgi:hypothetical protein